MTDHNSSRLSGATGSGLSRNVQLHVIRLTLNHLDEQLKSMRESDGESCVEADDHGQLVDLRVVADRERLLA